MIPHFQIYLRHFIVLYKFAVFRRFKMFVLFHCAPDRRCKLGFRFIRIMESENKKDLQKFIKKAGTPKKGKYLISEEDK